MNHNQIKQTYGPTWIYSGQDKDTLVEVIEEGDLRILHFGTSGRQSEMSLQNPYALVSEYARLMALSLLFQPNPNSILILGLGGGSLPKFLWKIFPECQMDLIERSPLVVDVCHQYFAFPFHPSLKIHVTDALRFVNHTQNCYDLLFIDLFDAEGVPVWLGETSFFNRCKDRLKDSRSLLVWNINAQTPEPRMSQCLYQLAASFGRNILIFPTKSGTNYVFFAFPVEIKLPLPEELAQRAKQLQEKIEFPFSQIWEEIQWIISQANNL